MAARKMSPSEIRSALGWTQEIMAEALQTKRTHYALMESGDRPITQRFEEDLNELAKIAAKIMAGSSVRKKDKVEGWVIEEAKVHLQKLINKYEELNKRVQKRTRISANNVSNVDYAERIASALKGAGFSAAVHNASKIHIYETKKQLLRLKPLNELIENAKLQGLKTEIAMIKSFLSKNASEKRK